MTKDEELERLYKAYDEQHERYKELFHAAFARIRISPTNRAPPHHQFFLSLHPTFHKTLSSIIFIPSFQSFRSLIAHLQK